MNITPTFSKLSVLSLALALLASSCGQTPTPIPPNNGQQPTLAIPSHPRTDLASGRFWRRGLAVKIGPDRVTERA